jgi:hypothetical protein
VRPVAAQLIGHAERARAELIAEGLIARLGSARAGRHVTQHHVVRTQLREHGALGAEDVELSSHDVGGQCLCDLGEVHREHLPGGADGLARVEAPGAGRGAQIEDPLPRAKQAVALVDLLQLEDATRRIARRFRGPCVPVRPGIVTRFAAH